MGMMSVVVLMTEVDTCVGDGDKIVKVNIAGKPSGECVKVVGALVAAPDWGGHCHYGWAVVAVDGVCEVGSEPQERRR